MMRELILSLVLVLVLSFGCSAREIGGVDIAETLTIDDATSLVLNGAGIRKKLFLIFILLNSISIKKWAQQKRL